MSRCKWPQFPLTLIWIEPSQSLTEYLALELLYHLRNSGDYFHLSGSERLHFVINPADSGITLIAFSGSKLMTLQLILLYYLAPYINLCQINNFFSTLYSFVPSVLFVIFILIFNWHSSKSCLSKCTTLFFERNPHENFTACLI